MKLALAIIPWLILLALWATWQTEGRAVFSYPRGIVSEYNGDGDAVHYYLVIGKEQVHPAGTIWLRTIGDGWSSSEPLIDGLTLQKAIGGTTP